MLKTSHWYRFHLFYLSFSPGCDLNARECFDGPAAPQQGMLGPLIVWWPASFWLQWTMAEGTVHTGSSAKFPTKPTEEWKKKLGKYMLDLSGTPGLRPIGLSPGSWQTSLGLGSMSRYSAQILICIVYLWNKWRFNNWIFEFFKVFSNAIHMQQYRVNYCVRNPHTVGFHQWMGRVPSENIPICLNHGFIDFIRGNKRDFSFFYRFLALRWHR